MTDERIMTLHPEGKKGVNILKSKYDRVKETLVSILEESGEIPWYVVSVKLDLEARGFIVRIPKSSPQRVKINE
ncbi:MAG: hypothetical protein GY940_32510 [bacterium]|nr:hypothetical protein [bacterium]